MLGFQLNEALAILLFNRNCIDCPEIKIINSNSPSQKQKRSPQHALKKLNDKRLIDSTRPYQISYLQKKPKLMQHVSQCHLVYPEDADLQPKTE